jgi:nucleoside phosphorylase
MYRCILFALHREAQPFLARLAIRRQVPGAPCPAWLCETSLPHILVLETGVGSARCLEALRWLTHTHLPGQGLPHPKFVLYAGFAGGLAEGWKVGDVLLAEYVVDQHGGVWSCDVPLEKTNLDQIGRRGRLVTTRELIGDPLAKRKLGKQHQACATDMEAAAAADFCARQGIPFGSVRSISDEVSTPLSPRLLDLLSSSGVSFRRLCGSLLRSPRLIFELLRLARDTRKAARTLADALTHLLFPARSAGDPSPALRAGRGVACSYQGRTRRMR